MENNKSKSNNENIYNDNSDVAFHYSQSFRKKIFIFNNGKNISGAHALRLISRAGKEGSTVFSIIYDRWLILS